MKVKHLFWLLSVFSFCILVYNYRSAIVKFLDREKRSPIELDNDIETESNDNEPTEFAFPNRTAEAENQDVVIFHRVPKTGSELMQELGKVREGSTERESKMRNRQLVYMQEILVGHLESLLMLSVKPYKP